MKIEKRIHIGVLVAIFTFLLLMSYKGRAIDDETREPAVTITEKNQDEIAFVWSRDMIWEIIKEKKIDDVVDISGVIYLITISDKDYPDPLTKNLQKIKQIDQQRITYESELIYREDITIPIEDMVKELQKTQNSFMVNLQLKFIAMRPQVGNQVVAEDSLKFKIYYSDETDLPK